LVRAVLVQVLREQHRLPVPLTAVMEWSSSSGVILQQLVRILRLAQRQLRLWLRWQQTIQLRLDLGEHSLLSLFVYALWERHFLIARQQQRQCQVKERTRSIRQLVKSHSSVLLDM
jgi:hypothetical protein